MVSNVSHSKKVLLLNPGLCALGFPTIKSCLVVGGDRIQNLKQREALLIQGLDVLENPGLNKDIKFTRFL